MVLRTASNWASCGELGRYPLFIEIVQHSLKYRGQTLKSNSTIMQNCIRQETKLEKQGINNILTNIVKSSTYSGINLTTHENKQTMQEHVQEVITAIKEKCTSFFLNQIGQQAGPNRQGGNKLRTYANFKNNYNVENYLMVGLPPAYIKSIASLRLSTHGLEIERGRYYQPPVPPERRVCQQCSSGTVEDETHFLFKCQKYQQQRRKMLETLEPMRNEPLTLENLFEWKERPPFMIIAKFIKECMGLRDKYVNT